MKTSLALLAVVLVAQDISALDVPSKVRSFYNRVKSGRCTGSDLLKSGFHNKDDSGSGNGPRDLWKEGKFVDRSQGGPTARKTRPDKRSSSTDPAHSRTWTSIVMGCRKAMMIPGNVIKDLNANIHPYAVFGNEGHYSPTFNPRHYGIRPLSVMAVICGEKLIYGVWGDTNGDDDIPLVGEASISLATACYGDKVTGDNGHDETDVLYVAFTGEEAVPGTSADWKADNYHDFEASIQNLGDKLIRRLS